jgi:class 3 adenylate cyclase
LRILIVDDERIKAERFRKDLNHALQKRSVTAEILIEPDFTVSPGAFPFDVYIVDIYAGKRLAGLQYILDVRAFHGEAPRIAVLTNGPNHGELELESNKAGANLYFKKSEVFTLDDRNFRTFVNVLLEGIDEKVENIDEKVVAHIVNSVRMPANVLALDTVSFSSRDDTMQLRIVKDFTRMVNEILVAKGVSSLITLFTGDGLILVLKAAGDSRLAFEVGVEMMRMNRGLSKYDLRIGVNNGDVQVVTLSNGAKQVIGHAINWCCRVMDAAGKDSMAISDNYYASVLGAGRESIAGVDFNSREAVDKLGNRLPLYDVAITY